MGAPNTAVAVATDSTLHQLKNRPPCDARDLAREEQYEARKEPRSARSPIVEFASNTTVHSSRVYDLASGKSKGPRTADPQVASAAMRLEGRMAYRAAKRGFDIVFSLLVLILLSWLFVGIALAVKLDDPRITRMGHIPRKTSLDELPQFFNVLKGDIPLCILKMRPEFSGKSMGAFALPAKPSTNEEKAFSQVVSCFESNLRMRRISEFNRKHVDGMERQFFAKLVFEAVGA